MIQKAQHTKHQNPTATVCSNSRQLPPPLCAPPCCLRPIGRHGLLPLLRGHRRRRGAGVAEEGSRGAGGRGCRRRLLQRRQEAPRRRGRDDGGRTHSGRWEDVRQRLERGGVPSHAAGSEGHQPGRHARVGGEIVTAVSCLVISSGGFLALVRGAARSVSDPFSVAY